MRHWAKEGEIREDEDGKRKNGGKTDKKEGMMVRGMDGKG